MGRKDLLLEKQFLNETLPEDNTISAAAGDFEKIRVSNCEILTKYPASAVERAVRAKIQNAQMSQKHVKRFTVRTAYFTAAAAAAVLFAFALPVLRMNSAVGWFADGWGVTDAGYENGHDRAKGAGPLLKVYRSENGKAVRLKTRDFVKPGDTLQLSYTASGDSFGMIFSVDGNGVLTQHFPDNGTAAARLEPKGEVPLNFSYRLDDAPGFERFVLITSAQPFTLPVLSAGSAVFADPDAAKNSDLTAIIPPSAHAADVLLLK